LNPSSDELKEIAKSITNLASALDFDSKNVAMLSYSTSGSGAGESADKVREAVLKLKSDDDFSGNCDLEYQFDSAYDINVREKKAPASVIKNKHSDIYIFPNLDSGNIGYKIAQRLGNFEATGPILTGLAKPVNDLSRGASKEDIINVSYITASQIINNEE
jgi:phosphate acetyltransferase